MNNLEAIGDFVFRKLRMLQFDEPASKAALARLRRGVGKSVSESPDTWMLVLDGMPEQLMNNSSTPSKPSAAELAVYTALTLFAVHQQGMSTSVNELGVSFGRAAGKLRSVIGSDGVQRRFDSVITSNDIAELSYHARGIIQMMRSSNIGTGLDYPRFARDLYCYQFPDSRRKTVLAWGQDYYRVDLEEDEKEV